MMLAASAGVAMGFAPTPLRPCGAACRISAVRPIMDTEVRAPTFCKASQEMLHSLWWYPRGTLARATGVRRTLILSCSDAQLYSIPIARSALQEIEFIIHPDGRVEERVLGVKGMACEALTLEINKALGEVYESKPTVEMFEQKVELSVDAENTVSESWGSGADSWGGGDGGSSSDGGQW